MSFKLLTPADCYAQWKEQAEWGRVPTGIEILDETLGGGVAYGQVTVVAGYTHSGKSELVRQIRNAMVAQNYGVLHVDVELGGAELFQRDAAQLLRLSPVELRNEQKAAAAGAVDELTKHQASLKLVTPDAVPPLAELKTSIRSCLVQAQKEVPDAHGWVLILDSIQRLAAGAPGGDWRSQVQSFMYAIDSFSRELNVSIIATSETSRDPKDQKGPMTIQRALRVGAESRAIEFASSNLWVLVAEDSATQVAGAASEEKVRAVRLMVAKNRSGPCGWLSSALLFKAPYWELDCGSRPVDTEEAVMHVMENAKGMALSINDIRMAAGKRYEAVATVLRQLLLKELVEIVQDGTKALWLWRGEKEESLPAWSDDPGPKPYWEAEDE